MFRSLIGHFFKPLRLTLDNLVFRLHYRVTVWLLIACAVALLWKINFGNPVNCISRDISSDLINDHCWYYGTFTNIGARGKTVGVDIPYPGIDSDSNPDRQYHNTHRWVVICIFVQAAFFYLPRIFWKCLEGRKIYKMIWNMNEDRELGVLKTIRKDLVIDFFRQGSSFSFLYPVFHFLCELLNLINVVVQLIFVTHILQLSIPALKVIVKSRSERDDVGAVDAFPVHTKCTYHMFGRSGDIQRHGALCFMSLNGVMEVIFACQWIWFTLLVVLSVLALVYRVLFLIPQFRAMRLESKVKLVSRGTVEKVSQHLSLGDWFVMYMLSKNLDPLHMRDILEALGKGLLYQKDYHSLNPIEKSTEPIE